jgi:intracellular multiplication protein IcmQ
MSDQENRELVEIARKMVKLFEELFAACDWNSSLFIRNAIKPLQKLQQDAEEILKKLSADIDQTTETPAQRETRFALEERPGYIKTFISLYQSEGSNLQKWQGALKNLVDQSVSRPIYRKEENIKELLRSKSDPMRQAYAVIFVPELSIIQAYQGKPSVDQFGNELLTIKERAITLENIVELVHMGHRYAFVNGKLIH